MTLLNACIKSKLYSELKRKSGIAEKKEQLYKNIVNFVIRLYNTYIISDEEKKLFEDSKNLFDPCCCIVIDYYDLGLTNDKTSYYPKYPNPKCPSLLEKEEYERITMRRDINIIHNNDDSYESLIMPRFCNLDRFDNKFISKIPENELQDLRILLISYFDSMYEEENFLQEYFSDCGVFLKNVRTVDQLSQINPEWVKIINEINNNINVNSSNKSNPDNKKETTFPEDDIEVSLTKLKDIIYSKQLVKDIEGNFF